MSDIPLETRLVLQRIVRQICKKVLGFTGPMFAMAVEFACRYYVALKSGNEKFKKDVKYVYKSFGLKPELINAIAKEIEERYG